MNQGIQVQIIWFDSDVVELRIFGSNGRFAGTAELYVSHGELSRLAKELRGFPESPGDRREFELGTFDEKQAGGGACMLFRCIDKSGSAVVELRLRLDGSRHFGRPETTDLVLPVEAAAVDDFVCQLESMKTELGATAVLRSLDG